MRALYVAIVIAGSGVLFVGSTKGQKKGGTPKPNTALIQSIKGPDLFRAHCAACHGANGTGNGPVTSALKKKPSDLTAIAERNGGQFPEARISRVIAGDEATPAHGSREMPVWGPIFHQIENDQDWGEVRLHNLIQYLVSIQRKRSSSTP